MQLESPGTSCCCEGVLRELTLRGEGQEIGKELTRLQHLSDLATSDSNSALAFALEATATTYGAIMSSQDGLSERVRDLYGTALLIKERYHYTYGLYQQRTA